MSKLLECGERLGIGRVSVFDAADILEISVFRSDSGIIETGRDRMGQLDLTVGIGEQPGLCALQDTELAALESCGMTLGHDAITAGFDTDHADIFIAEKRMEHADRIGSAANAGDEQIRQAAFALKDLTPRFDADDPVEIAHDHRERMRSKRRADDVMRVINRRDPIAHGFIDRFLQGGLTGGDRADLGTHQAHACDVERLAFHVDGAHVDHALHAEARADGGGRDSVLACAGFGDDALFAKPFGDEDLPEGVVDLVSAGVKEVFALEVNFRSAQFLRPALGEIKWRRAADIVMEEVVQLGMEGRIIFRRFISGRQFLQGSHQRLWHKHAAELAVVA